MRVLYVAPRYHTNQADIMSGWIENGDQVLFVSQYKGATEDYSSISPVVAGYSHLYELIFDFINSVTGKNNLIEKNRFKYGFPNKNELYRIIKDFAPDIAILRETCIYTISCYRICKRLSIPSILYNQTPYWQDKSDFNNGFAHRIVKKLVPGVRMTPVLGHKNIDSFHEKNVFYVPFVTKLHESPEVRNRKDILEHKMFISILCIGKFERRKNLLMMVRTYERLLHEFCMVRLVIAGECTSEDHLMIKKEIEEYISDSKLSEFVRLKTNVLPCDMGSLYSSASIFVLPSSHEPASISQLEAMSYSLPVICSNTNGTSCYIENGRNGWLFKDNDEESLYSVLCIALRNKDNLNSIGAEGYSIARENHSFNKYYSEIVEMKKRAEVIQRIKRG